MAVADRRLRRPRLLDSAGLRALGQFYRKDIFDSLGLAAPTTWEEYYEAAKAIRASDPDRYIAAFAFNQAPWLIGLSQQGGGEWFATEGDAWKVGIDDEATLKVAEFWQKLIDEDLVKIEADFSSEWNADIQNGNVASWISGSWADAIVRGTAPDTAGSWAVARCRNGPTARPCRRRGPAAPRTSC